MLRRFVSDLPSFFSRLSLVLFRQAKLSAPTTVVYYAKDEKEKIINIDTRIFQKNRRGIIEVLVKPNAGGFGAGIKKIHFPCPSDATNPQTESIIAKTSIPSSFEDGMALVQQYEKPIDGKIYRVWFLNGKVQCAVRRQVSDEKTMKQGDSSGVSSSTEFTSGCAGGASCKYPRPVHENNTTMISSSDNMPSSNRPRTSVASTAAASNMLPWKVPEEVRQEIEDQLLPLLIDARCGSVEFLYGSLTLPEAEKANRYSEDIVTKTKQNLLNESAPRPCTHSRRLYFDLNLLSTLPLVDHSDGAHKEMGGETIWPDHFDPWLELANGIWEFVLSQLPT